MFAVALGQTSNMTGQAAHPVSVKDFGAKGDGVTDDTKAIQAALTSVPTGIVTIPREQRLLQVGKSDDFR